MNNPITPRGIGFAIQDLEDLHDVDIEKRNLLDRDSVQWDATKEKFVADSSPGQFAGMIQEGLALGDDGNLYPNVQDAVDASTSVTVVGPGTFSESVSITESDFLLLGYGKATIIDGGTAGDALTLDGSDIQVSRLSVQTTAGQGNNFSGLVTTANAVDFVLSSLYVLDSDQHGLSLQNGGGGLIAQTRVLSADEDGIHSTVTDIGIENSLFRGAGGDGLFSSGNRNRVLDNLFENNGDNGAVLSGTDQVLIDNLARNSNQNASGSVDFDLSGATDIVERNNRDLT